MTKNICTNAATATQRTIIELADAFNIPVGRKFRAREKSGDEETCNRYNNVFFNGEELVCCRSKKVGGKKVVSHSEFFKLMIG